MAFPTGYTKYQEITIDYTKVAADLTDYVISVNLADLVKAGADIFDTCRSDGGDIRATKTDGTTELATELVIINTTTKTGELYIKFTGTLSSSSNTIIRIYYNGTDTALAASATFGRNNTWSSTHDMVHHFQDSTINAVAGNSPASNTFSYDSAGKIGKGVTQTAGSSRGMDWASSITANTSTLSFSSWFKTSANTSIGDGSMILFMYCRPGSPYERFYLSLLMGATSGDRGKVQLFLRNSSGVSHLVNGSLQYNDNTWYRVSGIYDGTNLKTYINGVQVATLAATGTVGASFKTTLGTSWDESTAGVWVGEYDEMRFSDAYAFSANWLLTEYRNQNSTSTFYSSGAELGGSTIVSPAVQVITSSLPARSVKVGVVVPIAAKSLTFSIPAYAVSGKARVSVNAQTAQFTIPAYALIAAGVSIAAKVQALTFSVPTAAILSGATLYPNTQSITITLPASATTGAARVGVNPVVLTLTIPTLEYVGAIWGRTARETTGADWTRSIINNDA